jgi:hypothetical protein
VSDWGAWVSLVVLQRRGGGVVVFCTCVARYGPRLTLGPLYVALASEAGGDASGGRFMGSYAEFIGPHVHVKYKSAKR